MITYFFFDDEGQNAQVVTINDYDYFEFFRKNSPSITDILDLGNYYVEKFNCKYFEVNY